MEHLREYQSDPDECAGDVEEDGRKSGVDDDPGGEDGAEQRLRQDELLNGMVCVAKTMSKEEEEGVVEEGSESVKKLEVLVKLWESYALS